jgi:DNA polymerase-1
MNRNERKRLVRSIVEPYLTARKDKTQINILKRIKPGADGRIRTVLSVSTETGRLASSESLVDESTNLQNMSNITSLSDPLYRVRDCFIADEGMTLLAVDHDKAEAVALAAMSRDWDYYERLHAGEDVHSWHAGHFFGVQEWIDGGRADKVQRQLAKNATFASNYMASQKTIQNTVNAKWEQIGRKVSFDEIMKIHKIYLNLHPLKRWWQETAEEVSRRGYLINPFGFKRRFYNPDSHKRLKEALAFQPQSTVASNINRSLIEIDQHLRPDEGQFLLQVHDELLFQVYESKVMDVYHLVREVMERPFIVHGQEVHIPASGKMGACWGTMQEISMG